MQATTLTSIVMVIFALGVISLGLYNLFGSWQPEVRRLSHDERVEAEYQIAVRQMRRAIREYERNGPRPD